jgi:hypothetical protein
VIFRSRIRAAPCRHVGRHQRGRLVDLAGRDEIAVGLPERQRQAVWPRHILASLRCRVVAAGDRGRCLVRIRQRCLFGSNFPIEKLWTDYRSIVSAVNGAISGLNDAERDAVFCANAMRLYRL